MSGRSRRSFNTIILRLGAAVLCVVSGVAFAASLYYSPSFGLAGHFLNQSLLSILGWPAYALPPVVVWVGWRLWRERSLRQSWLYWAGSALMPLVGFGLLVVIWGLMVYHQPDIAGAWGWSLANSLIVRIGYFGAVLLVGGALLLWSYAAFGIPWLKLAGQGWQLIRKDCALWWQHWQQSRKIRIMASGTSERVRERVSSEAEGRESEEKTSERVKKEVSLIEPVIIAPKKADRWGENERKNGKKQPRSLVSSGRWKLPPLDLLKPPDPAGPQEREDAIYEERAQSLLRALDTFNVPVSLDGIEKGPVVSRYDVVPRAGIKVSQIETLVDDIALAMKVESVRIVGLIAGKGAIGIEVPNPKRRVVRFREVLEHPSFSGAQEPLLFAMGRLANGEPISCNLAEMPHLLIAGATGSGKSVLIHTIISSLLYRLNPSELKLILIDPKRLELPFYDGIPHLFDPRKMPQDVRVITDSKEASKSLSALVDIMEARYERFSEKSVRNIVAFNEKAHQEGFRPESYIVVIIDELADMILVAGKEVEYSIQRLAQKARAVGIHLVLATQRPSVNVITGVIKANLPARVALQVVSNTDSRVILDSPGAETLLGMGDMLYLAPGEPRPVRLQGAYISDEEIKNLVSFWKAQGGPDYEDPSEMLGLKTIPGFSSKLSKEDEANIREALQLVLERRRVSQDLLKDYFRTSSKATNILSQLEIAGFIFKPEGSNRWEIRYDRIEEFLQKKS